MKNIFYTSCY